MTPQSFLAGERLYLRALEPADAEGPYVGWFNDAEVCRGNSHHVYPYTPEAARAYIERARQTRDDLILAMVVREGHRHIGNLALEGIHRVNRSADFAIMVGERDTWGKGYAKEAAVLLIGHGFEALNLHRVSCGTFEDNEGMRRLALALGMKEEGRRRQAVFKNGRYVDVIEFGILAEEWRKNVSP